MTETSDAKKSPAKSKGIPGVHDVKITTESDDNGNDHLVVSCEPCGYAQTVPAADETEAAAMARNHQHA